MNERSIAPLTGEDREGHVGLAGVLPLFRVVTMESDVPFTEADWSSLSCSENWLLTAATFSMKKEAKTSAETSNCPDVWTFEV